MLSIVSMLRWSSVGLGAIVGGNVEMSATGPISLSKWNSASGSPNGLMNAPWPLGACDGGGGGA